MGRCCCHLPVPPVCPPEPIQPLDFYAQYSIRTNGASGSFAPFREVFRFGEEIHLENETTILLSAGYLYLISYLTLATPEPDSYMELVPYLNDSPRLNYAFFAPTGSASRNTSAVGSFTTNEAANKDITFSLRLTYPETVNNIDLTGTVSITPLMRIGQREG